MRIAYLSEKLLLALGIVKMSLLALFFLSFSFVADNKVHAQEVCVGENLLTKMESENPELYEQVLVEAAKIENGSAILWRIEKEGLQPSWLYGTMHMADPAISTLQPDIIDVLNQVETVVIETTDVIDPEAAKAAMTELAHLTLLPWSSSLKDLVKDDLEDKLDEAVSARGIPAFLANRMQPWVIATTIALPICEMERQQAGESVLDAALGRYALDNDKKVKGLETSKEQLEAIAKLPQDYHVSALEETLQSGDLSLNISETMKALYLSGEISKIMPLMRAVSPESFTTQGAEDFDLELIRKRNFKMAERVLPMLEAESILLAVGALHLPGETGIVKQLREKGYTVTAIR